MDAFLFLIYDIIIVFTWLFLKMMEGSFLLKRFKFVNNVV